MKSKSFMKQTSIKEKPLKPTTTTEQDTVTAGQRKINLIWEFTQALIAVLVTIAFLYCQMVKIDSNAVNMAFSLIIGFYFSRTNHSAIGGVGRKPIPSNVGTR